MAQEIADSTLLETWSSGGNIVKPDSTKIIEGWQLGEQPPHEYMNWLQNTFGSKLNHILKNGVASWNNTTQYLAGSSVQHNGNVWLCKTTNTNSTPTDANSNWKRIITVESLPDIPNDYVALTGNQTIEGIKTFSSTISGSINGNSGTVTNGVYTTGDQTIEGVKTFSASPIVPTPTTGTQAVNKDYADLKLALTDFIGANQSKVANGYQKLPGGLIIQWGTATFTGEGTAITFPISFPSNCVDVNINAKFDNGFATVYDFTTTGFYTSSLTGGVNTSGTNSYSWFAIGY